MGGIALIIIAIGGAIGSMVTSNILDQLKRQVNKIISRHKPDVDKLKMFQQLLKQLDLEDIYKLVEKMSQDVSKKFQSFLVSQKERINKIKNIRIETFEKDSLTDVWSKLLGFLNIIGTGLTAISLVTATNPVTIVVSVIAFALSGILGVISTINNILAIEQLKRKKQELNQYFKPGGQFQQNQIKLKNSAIQLVKNFYILVVNGRNLVKMLTARILLLQMETQDLKYAEALKVLESQPFDLEFQNIVNKTYLNLVSIENQEGLRIEGKINRMYATIDHLINNFNVPQKLKKFTNLLIKFAKDGEISKNIEKQYENIKIIEQIRADLDRDFDRRSELQDKYKMLSYDHMILEQINDIKFPKDISIDKKKLYIAGIVSFYTSKFYGDNLEGNTLYGYNLQQLQKKTRLLEYINVFQMTNAFLLPQPLQNLQKLDWSIKRDKLIQQFVSTNPDLDPPQFQNMFLRINNKTYNELGQTGVKLQVKYGVILTVRGIPMQFQLSMEELNRATMAFSKFQFQKIQFPSPKSYSFPCEKAMALKGVEYALNGQLGQSLNLLQSARRLNQPIPQAKKNLKIGEKTLQEYLNNFTGISINMKEVELDQTSIRIKNNNIPIQQQVFSFQSLEFVCSCITRFVIGICEPWRVEGIEVIKSEDGFVGKVQWSDESNHEDFTGRILSNCIVQNASELKDLAERLRNEDKQLWIITVTNFQQTICWYLE